MSTLTVEMPDELAARLAAASERQQVPPAQIVREALAKVLPEEGAPPEEGGLSEPSALDALRDMVGCFDSGMTDLATNPKYMEGFGQWRRSSLLDAGPLVALMDQRESHHDWTKDAFARLQLPLMTCQAVLTEAFFLLRGQPGPLAKLYRHIEAGRFVDSLDFDALAPRIMELMERYANVPMSFADACLVALADEKPVAKVLTLDRDFLIYRHANGRPLDLLAPFVDGSVGR